MTFQGRSIRFGGLFPVRVLRLFRAGRGRCENRPHDSVASLRGGSQAGRQALLKEVVYARLPGGVRPLIFLGSSCIYPKLASQPIREDSLLTGPLEPTNMKTMSCWRWVVGGRAGSRMRI